MTYNVAIDIKSNYSVASISMLHRLCSKGYAIRCMQLLACSGNKNKPYVTYDMLNMREMRILQINTIIILI